MALDDAPILTQPQMAALEFIDEQSDHGELWACVSQFHMAALNNLEKRGFITLREEDGDMWAMPTDDGLLAAIWNIPADSREAYIERGHDVKRAEKKQQMKTQKQVELSDWEKQAMENLTPKQVAALETIWDAGNSGWCDVEVHHKTRVALIKYGYIEYLSGRYRITETGLNQLEVEWGRVKVEASDNGAGLDNADSVVDPTPADETPLPLTPSPQAARGNCGDDCDECVYREVVALLSDKYPEVGELAAAMRTKKKVLARLKLGGS